VLDPHDFLRGAIRPALARLRLGGAAAERLLLGTALTESGLVHLRQAGGGPARGLYQIEPATHRDLWRSYLAYRPVVAARLLRLAAPGAPGAPGESQLVWNLAYATGVARLIYRRRPEPLPAAADLEGLARYWKAHFNSAAGRGRAADFLRRAGPLLNALIEEETA